MEIWKDVVGFEGLYQVSDLGNIKSLRKLCKTRWEYMRVQEEKMIKLKIDRYGYPALHISKDAKRYDTTVHRLVAQAFIPNPDNLPQINHKNGIKTDNRVENLEWCTAKHNSVHRELSGLGSKSKGVDRGQAKMTDDLVVEARKRYSEGGISIVNLAKDYPVCPQTLHSILLRKTWNHI